MRSAMGKRNILGFAVVAGVWAVLLAAAARGAGLGVSMQELGRIDGQAESELVGFGLVVGLPGTGDSAEQLVVARPLAQLLRNQGNPVGDLEELAEGKSAALVQVRCVVDKHGAKAGDRFDITVSALHNPKSLRGGELILTPLRGPFPGDPVYAIASGRLILNGANPVSGLVRGGAKMVKNIDIPTFDAATGTMTFIIDSDHAGWTTSQLIANTINDVRLDPESNDPMIAHAVDERSVRIVIPEAELANPGNFLAQILDTRFDPSLITLPARVSINSDSGVIVASSNATISPVSVSWQDFTISTVTPASERNELDVAGSTPQSEDIPLQDLLEAFKGMAVPTDVRISILREIDRIGRLHAELVYAE